MTEERGAATILVVACAGLLLVVGSALGAVSALVVDHRRAQSAADLAALAGASAAEHGQDACAAAAGVATANDADLVGCTTDGFEVTVGVTVPGPTYAGRRTTLGASSRAGPDPRERRHPARPSGVRSAPRF